MVSTLDIAIICDIALFLNKKNNYNLMKLSMYECIGITLYKKYIQVDMGT